jgi:hypothetical protein
MTNKLALQILIIALPIYGARASQMAVTASAPRSPRVAVSVDAIEYEFGLRGGLSDSLRFGVAVDGTVARLSPRVGVGIGIKGAIGVHPPYDFYQRDGELWPRVSLLLGRDSWPIQLFVRLGPDVRMSVWGPLQQHVFSWAVGVESSAGFDLRLSRYVGLAFYADVGFGHYVPGEFEYATFGVGGSLTAHF